VNKWRGGPDAMASGCRRHKRFREENQANSGCQPYGCHCWLVQQCRLKEPHRTLLGKPAVAPPVRFASCRFTTPTCDVGAINRDYNHDRTWLSSALRHAGSMGSPRKRTRHFPGDSVRR
jgi:hypothetical protein